MGSNNLVELVMGIFIIAIFVTSILPALSQATGQSTTIFQILLVLLVLASIAKVVR